jgi:FeS assembly SUF system protein
METKPLNKLMLEGEIIQQLHTVFDPEIPVDIYELGLIYDIDIQPDGFVTVRMTLTSPACPAAGQIPVEVEEKVRKVAGVKDVLVDIVWDPPWTPERMSEAAKLELGFF